MESGTMSMDVQGPKPGALKRQGTSRRSEFDASGQEIVKVGCFSRNVVKHPCCIMWPVFIAAVFIGIIPNASGRVAIDPSQFAGFDTDSIPQQVDYSAWSLGVSASDYIYGSASSDDDDLYTSMTTFFMYGGLPEGENVLTAEGVAAMASVEASLLDDALYDPACVPTANYMNSSITECSPPASLLNYIYENAALHESQCKAGYCWAYSYVPPPVTEAGLVGLCTSSGYSWGTFPCTSTIYNWQDGTLAAESAWAGLVYGKLCALTDGYSQAQLSQILPAKDLVCTAVSLSAPYVRSIYSMQTGWNQTNQEWYDENEEEVDAWNQAMQDAVDAVSATPAAGSVTSTKPKDGKNINVFMQAYWTDPAGRRFFAYLFGDMTLAAFSLALVIIILLVNTGSAVLMLAGLFEILFSLPMAMFLWMVIGQTVVSTMELLGLFLILCIGADDIFVFTDTWEESRFMPPSISGSTATRFAWTYGRAASAMLTTTATTCITLILNATSPFALIKSFGIFNMFVVFWDYVLVITWYAITVVALSGVVSKTCPPGYNWEMSCCCPGKPGADGPAERKTTAFMRNKFAPFLHKARYLLTVACVALLVGGIYVVSTNFQEGEQQFLPEAHPVTQFGEIQTTYFGGNGEDTKFQIVLMYGLQTDKPITYPQSRNFFISSEDGYNEMFTTNYDSSATFGPAVQQQIVDDCNALAANADLVANGEVYCVLNELQKFAPDAFPYADEASLLTALGLFYASPAYANLLYSFRYYQSYTNVVTTPAGDGIDSIFINLNSTIPTTLNVGIPSQVTPYYDDWTAAVEPLCTDAPCVMACNQGIFERMATLSEMRNNAIQNIGLALIVSYVVLVVTTMNLLVPFLAIFSIGSTIVWSLGTFFLWGYQFNANAAILSVMAVGLAVDYAVHIVHFYNEASGDRYEKTQDALHGVGISVIGGAVTTGGAAVPLLFAKNFVFFQMAGVFIFFTAVWGLIFSFFLLCPLLMVLGPTGEIGDLRAIFRCCFPKKPPPKGDAGPTSTEV